MSRIRTIHPQFPRSSSMTRVSRDARLLFIQLWLVADDAGRLRFEPRALLDDLYPSDTDAAPFLAAWLDQLEREKCIERYSVDGKPYLRIRGWRKYQNIQHPTPSGLPGAPHEIREVREESRRSQQRRASSRDVHESPDDSDAPVEVTEQGVLRDIRRIQRNSEADRRYTDALRVSELMGRKIGMWGGRGAAATKPTREPAYRNPSPGEIHGLPDLNSDE